MSRIPKPSTSSPNKRISRIPGPSSSTTRTPSSLATTPGPAKPSGSNSLKPPASPLRSVSPSKSPARPLNKSASKSSLKGRKPPSEEDEIQPPKPPMSIREAIALRRAQAKTALQNTTTGNAGTLIDISPPGDSPTEDTDLGRSGVVETVQRARSSGSLNVSSRSLKCLPSCLFDIHLGIHPKPLSSVPEDSSATSDITSSDTGRPQPSWFEAQDLTVIKAGNNEIVEIHSEISLFGSLKSIDLHKNCLATLPLSLGLLSLLTNLDVSSNRLISLHPSLFALPSLVTLNVSHNSLTTLPLSQFATEIPDAENSGDFYGSNNKRVNKPLPALQHLDVSHNKLTMGAVDTDFLPENLVTASFSHNPLGSSTDFLPAFSKLRKLKELELNGSDMTDSALAASPSSPFPQLQLLDLGETKVTEAAVRSFFANSARNAGLTFDISTSEPAPGELRVVLGKLVVKEAWEIEAERRFQQRQRHGSRETATSPSLLQDDATAKAVIEKEPWELEAEQGLNTEAAKRRARLAAASVAADTAKSTQQRAHAPVKAVQKEAWEIEAEQGLLTEGGRRRARAQAAAMAKTTADNASTPASTSLSSSSYYDATSKTLTLPPSSRPSRTHMRAVSLAVAPKAASGSNDLVVPTPTLPLSVIVKQDFAASLRVLRLCNRRADPSFSLPALPVNTSYKGLLPNLDELDLEGCNLNDMVATSSEKSPDAPSEGAATIDKKQNTLELIADLFPSLGILNLSYNALTSNALSADILTLLLVPSPARKGLKILRLRGNKLTSLSAFENVASLFRANRQVENWRLEELDVRDNELGALPVLMGLLPMEVFMVDGNVFRIPPRKVWEREGTMGLLSWLRGRIE